MGRSLAVNQSGTSDDILGSLYKTRMYESDQLTQNRVGNVRTRNESKSLMAELSEVEDHGKEMHGSEKDQSPKL